MKQIELLLLENVDNLGIVGDVVRVRPGYARNYLLPHGLAGKPTPGAIEQLAERRRQEEKRLHELREQQKQMIQRLDGHELTLQRAANDQGVLFGGVSQHDVSEALRAEGFEVDDRWVRVGEQIKRLDSYDVPIEADKQIKAQIKLWVVSDKPAEQLEEEDVEADRSEADEPDPVRPAST